jgi:hypothetical protein
MRPPKHAIYSRMTALPWFREQYAAEKDVLFECVQQPGRYWVASTCINVLQHRVGELLFVPTGWSHGILNIETSIGAALEFAPPGWPVSCSDVNEYKNCELNPAIVFE